MKKLTTILMIMILPLLLFAEGEPVTIQGIVKDKVTREGVPFAHVFVDDQVTISNINGEFSLEISYENDLEVILQVSYLGYEPLKQAVTDFDRYLELFIEVSVTALDEVVVRSGPTIMDRVFRNMHLNYIMEPLHMETYYLESLRDTLGFRYVTEGILDVYTPSNVDKFGNPWAHLLRSRKRVYKPVKVDNLLAGNASDMAHHSIWRFDSFLHKRNRDKYEFYYDGTTTMGQHSVLVVEFEPKSRKGNTTGRLYIDDITYAILKMEYHPNTTKSEFWDYVYWTEEFELIDGSFELVNVSYEGLAEKGEEKYEAVLVINSTKVSYQVPDDQILLGTDMTIFEAADETPSVESFWKGYNSLKLNQRVEVQLMSDKYGFEY
ncbi:MAG: carboxypeptidase-like regulatory domain-containing protein [Bacteroidota bacterium]